MIERPRLKILRSGDPKTLFRSFAPAQILDAYGLPKSLLSRSAKADKCESVGVLNRVLYLTPGVFCPAATAACLAGCLGHTSGNMQLPGSGLARDQRSALYLEDPAQFLTRLRVELRGLLRAAKRRGVQAAVRLNGTSDLPWERLHPELFFEFPEIQFFDYTKILPRMNSFIARSIDGPPWPENYHLTFSADGRDRTRAVSVLERGGNVALVFWPELPSSWWGFEVISGDSHDARFLDPKGVIVGLQAKGVARVDTDGFVVRPCPMCGPNAPELVLISRRESTHRTLLHGCRNCGHQSESRWMLPHALQIGCRQNRRAA